MSALSIQVPYQIFADSDGTPLDNGYVWIGTTNLDPRTNPVNVYFDAALTQVAPNPLRTVNGYVYNAGSPAQLYIDGVNFSLRVEDKKSVLVYSFPSGSGISPNANGIVYTPDGTGAVATTVQAQLRNLQAWSVNVMDAPFYVTGTGDETTKVQTALNSGAKKVIVPHNLTVSVSALSVAANQTLVLDGTLNKITGSSPVVFLQTNSRLVGEGSIIGNGFSTDLVAATGVSGVRVKGITMSGNVGNGVALYAGCTRFEISDNVLTNVNGNAIQVVGTSAAMCRDGRISNNSIYRNTMPIMSTNYHGIVWDGGNASSSQLIGVQNITITGNTVRNVVGGIWGTLGTNITVTGNDVQNCSDVGIDFEGCVGFTAAGNTVSECSNGCLALLFGSSKGDFSGNTAINTTANGAAFYSPFTGTYSNAYINITGNYLQAVTQAINCVADNGKSLSNSTIVGNTIVSTSNVGISIDQNTNLKIDSNQVTTIGSAVGILLKSVSNSTVISNDIFGNSDTNSNPSNGGGITLFGIAGKPASLNVVRNNKVLGHVYGIVDSCAANVALSLNDIQYNNSINVYRSTGGTYNGVTTNNVLTSNPNTGLIAVQF